MAKKVTMNIFVLIATTMFASNTTANTNGNGICRFALRVASSIGLATRVEPFTFESKFPEDSRLLIFKGDIPFTPFDQNAYPKKGFFQNSWWGG